MFGKSIGEILEITGVILGISILVFGLIWSLLKGMGVDMSDLFNNINRPALMNFNQIIGSSLHSLGHAIGIR